MAELLLGGTVDPSTHERSGDLTTLDTSDLMTHGVITGMTGSGKTGLGVVLIEEVLRAGLPALLIDPKGDLTNLALTFPALSGAEFRPWIDEAEAKAAGQSPDDFAAAQAAAWKEGLAGWDLTGDHIAALRAAADVTIYTPGSNAGVPLDIVGSLQAPDTDDEEVIGDEIDGIVSGLLGLIGIGADPLSSKEHILLANLVLHAWTAKTNLDLATLVGQVQTPPIRKLGVFELDQFYPADERGELAVKLNGLLASPAFAVWGAGQPLDIQTMLYTPDGTPRCAVVTIAHLSEEERQFITAMVLSKAVTWMRRQSGTGDLRALLYMDEVMGYLPPTANPPSKQPIMTLMKQARACGLGVVLSTQNPVDIDYKAISNAGTWMIGRLQTERDKDRLLDGMTSAAGDVDVRAVGRTIGGLAKREFVVRRAGEDHPEIMTTRWAMSYLRGPMTRDQIAAVMDGHKEPPHPATEPATPTAGVGADESPVMPAVADAVPVRWIDRAAPWVAEVGGDPAGGIWEAAIVARVALRFDEAKFDVTTDQEYEAVLFPLGAQPDPATAVAVDYDDRDLKPEAPPGAVYRLTDAPVSDAAALKQVERGLIDHLVASQQMQVSVNTSLDLFSRPGESADDFSSRCLRAANDRADADTARLRDKYEAKAATLRERRATAADRAAVMEEQRRSRRNSTLLSTAGSVLDSLLGGRSSRGSLLGKIGRAAGSSARSSTDGRRVDAANDKLGRIDEQLAQLDAELSTAITEIDTTWMTKGKDITTRDVALERTDVRVTQIVCAWMPVA